MFNFSSIVFSFPLWLLIWMIFFTPHAQPQTKPPAPAPTTVAGKATTDNVADTTALLTPAKELRDAKQEAMFFKLESRIFEEQAILRDLERVRSDKDSAYAELCKLEGLPAKPDICGIDKQLHRAVKLTK